MFLYWSGLLVVAVQAALEPELSVKVLTSQQTRCNDTIHARSTTFSCEAYNASAFNYVIVGGYRAPYHLSRTNHLDMIPAVLYHLLTYTDSTVEPFNLITVYMNQGLWYTQRKDGFKHMMSMYHQIKLLAPVLDRVLFTNHTGLTRVICESLGCQFSKDLGRAHFHRTRQRLYEVHHLDPWTAHDPVDTSVYEFTQVIMASRLGFFAGLWSPQKAYHSHANLTVYLNSKYAYLSRCYHTHMGTPLGFYVDRPIDLHVCGFPMTWNKPIRNYQCSHQMIWIWYLHSLWKPATCLTASQQVIPVGFYSRHEHPSLLHQTCVTYEDTFLPHTMVYVDDRPLDSPFYWRVAFNPQWKPSLESSISGWTEFLMFNTSLQNPTIQNQLDVNAGVALTGHLSIRVVTQTNFTHILNMTTLPLEVQDSWVSRVYSRYPYYVNRVQTRHTYPKRYDACLKDLW